MDKSVNVELIRWTSVSPGGAVAGSSWAITFSGWGRGRGLVYNPVVIPRPLTGRAEISYPDAGFSRCGGKAGERLIKRGKSVVSSLWMTVHKYKNLIIPAIGENSFAPIHMDSSSSSLLYFISIINYYGRYEHC